MTAVFKGFTFFEIIVAILILGFLLTVAVITFSGTITGKSVEGKTEKIAGLIRSAQLRAQETETSQAIFLSRKEILWKAYPLENDSDPFNGEKVREEVLKDAEITEIFLENKEVIVPEEPTRGIAVVIDEKGIMTDVKITISNKDVSNWIVINERRVDVGMHKTKEVMPLWIPSALIEPAPVSANAEIIVCKTEPLLSRGWQTIQLNNVKGIKEAKIKIKTDSRMPASSHFHVYVFYGRYENKRSAAGVNYIPPDNPDNRPVGNWNADESVLIANSKVVFVPSIISMNGYYLYKNKVELMPSPIYKNYPEGIVPKFTMYEVSLTDEVTIPGRRSVTLQSTLVEMNIINPGSISDFAMKNSEESQQIPYIDYYAWYKGYASMKFSSQRSHDEILNSNEILPGDCSVLAIPIIPSTEFIKIMIADYHKSKETSQEHAFNLYPTITSYNSSANLVDAFSLDYTNDPFVYMRSWMENINNPLWFSLYAYALKPLVRPSSFYLLASKGPVAADNYRGFWYGPVLLDWDKLIGEEGIYELLGWFSGMFEPENWHFSQYTINIGQVDKDDTYRKTYAVSPVHYWLKNFSSLPYWLLFQYAVYNSQLPSLPKRIQEPFGMEKANLIDSVFGSEKIYNTIVSNNFKIWQSEYQNSSQLRQSSCLSISLMQQPQYPVWFASIPAIFGQQKIVNADLYSALYYLQERINHIMLDAGMWLKSKAPQPIDPLNEYEHVSFSLFDKTSQKKTGEDQIFGNFTTLGNLEKWSIVPAGYESNTASWWSWYQSIPWAKFQAFPDPTGKEARIGWNIPVMSAIPSYASYPLNQWYLSYQQAGTYNYDILNGAYSMHTLYFNTAHYPLGTIQIVIKKK